ncbi:MAG: hypothetical protein LC676_17355 [Loktanella sp.]|nr:hypothetical protein [Loktanella sp.]
MERLLPYIFAVFLVLLGLFLGTELLLALENGVLFADSDLLAAVRDTQPAIYWATFMICLALALLCLRLAQQLVSKARGK